MPLSTRLDWAGVDEAGRGPLAGPVVAAAVLIPKGLNVTGIRDSKAIAAEAREEAAHYIKRECRYGIGVASVAEIDQFNILQATFLAMRRALTELGGTYEGVLVDGNRPLLGVGSRCETVVKGDATFAEIAAASILAKTARDQTMREYHVLFPEYGFDRHFGYATPDHLRALSTFGPTPIHRRSFRPISEMLLQPCLTPED